MKVLTKRRVLAAGVAGALSLIGTPAVAAPSAASDSGPLGIQVQGAALTPGSAPFSSGNIEFLLSDPSITSVRGLTLNIDTSALPAGITLNTDNNVGWQCDTATGTVTCSATGTLGTWGSANTGDSYVSTYFFLNYAAAADAAVKAGSLRVTVSATDLNTVTETVPVDVAQPVALVGGPEQSFSGAPGSTYSRTLTVTNSGTTTIHGVKLYAGGDYGFDLVKRYSNCVYVGSNVSACTFDNDLAPGVTYAVSEPVSMKIAADHVAPFNGAMDSFWDTPADFGTNLEITGVPGDGAPLGLVVADGGAAAPPLTEAGLPQTNTSNLDDGGANNSEFTYIQVTGSNPANLAAVGASIPAPASGASVSFSVGVSDRGPAAAALSRSGDPITGVTVVIPTGTTVRVAPAACAPIIGGQPDWDRHGQPGAAQYECAVYQDLPVNGSALDSFTVEVPAGTRPYVGSVTITNAGNANDASASIVITPRFQAPPPPPGHHGN